MLAGNTNYDFTFAVWCVGCVLYELVCKKMPFIGSDYGDKETNGLRDQIIHGELVFPINFDDN